MTSVTPRSSGSLSRTFRDCLHRRVDIRFADPSFVLLFFEAALFGRQLEKMHQELGHGLNPSAFLGSKQGHRILSGFSLQKFDVRGGLDRINRVVSRRPIHER